MKHNILLIPFLRYMLENYFEKLNALFSRALRAVLHALELILASINACDVNKQYSCGDLLIELV